MLDSVHLSVPPFQRSLVETLAKVFWASMKRNDFIFNLQIDDVEL